MMRRAAIGLLGLLMGAGQAANVPPAVTASEFIFETAPFPSCHASTIVETGTGDLLAAWFDGQHEKAPDVGIWVSRHEGAHWSPPVEVADGVQEDGLRLPCWNPVLFAPAKGPLMLFYKVGPDPRSWWGMLRTSDDDGRTWNPARRLPEGIMGPVKNKPIELPGGDLLCPSSVETQGSPAVWRLQFERTGDFGQTWQKTAPPPSDGEPNAIQPSILRHTDGRLQAVGRTREGKIFETWSADYGKTWTPVILGELPNPNAGTDALTLADGRQLLVYNHTAAGRSPLNIAISADGKKWLSVLELEREPKAEFSYPACIQSRDGLVHITYTWKRQRIKHVVVDPAKLPAAE